MEFISLLLIFITMLLLTLIKLTKSKNSKLPPGPRKLPIIGNLHQLAAKNTLPHRRLAELAKEYGPIMHLHIGEVPTVVISSADMAREVMKTHDGELCSRPSILLAEYIFYRSSDIAFTPYGEYWRQARKMATMELLTAKRVLGFRREREEEVANLVESTAMAEGSQVSLRKKFFGLSFDISSRLAFNKKGKEQEEFRTLLQDASKLGAAFSISDLYPSLKFLPLITGMKRKLQALVRTSEKILNPLIQEHLSKKTLENEDDRKDLLDYLLTFHNVESGFSLSMDNIKSLTLEIFMAGSDTSTTAMEWVMAELLKNPRVMEKVQDEIRQVVKFQGKEIVNETNLEDLKYLKQVIKETLRLHPPFPLLLPRESMEKCEINGYEIPPKTRVLVNAWAIGRDPKYWSEPERFNPERFENSSINYKGNNYELIPFGAGRRMCPGLGLGMANVELPIAMLLYHFDWKLPNQDLNMDEAFGATVRTKHDLLVIPSLHPCSPLKKN